MKNLKIFLSLTFLLSLPLSATTVSISGTTVFKSDSTTLLPAGSFISVGYFDGSFANFSGLGTRTWSDIGSSDYTEIFNSTVSPDGEASGSGSASGIEGSKLYAWFFDTSSAPASTVNLQEFGLYTGSTADWTASGDNFVTDFDFLDISTIDNAVFGSNDAGTSISLSPAVPETSMYALILGIVGLTFSVIRRRAVKE